jgi:DNA-binding transcriptional LysR family regulator
VPEHWLGRTLGTVRFRVYARRGGRGLPRRATAIATLLRTSPWIAFEREIAANRFGRWMQERIPAAQVRARIDNFNSMAAMLRTGLGIGVLPTVIEPTEPDLVPISGEIDEIATPLWILCHPDLRRTARIQAFMREVGEGLSAALEAAPRA